MISVEVKCPVLNLSGCISIQMYWVVEVYVNILWWKAKLIMLLFQIWIYIKCRHLCRHLLF